jgi:hypothetical protein
VNDGRLPLPVVDALELDEAHREVLKPGELLPDPNGRLRRLPRFFYRIDSWSAAQSIQLAEHFSLSEFIRVDVREASLLRVFPRYVPCAIPLIAAHLELLRRETGAFVHIAANGGYRTPAHRLTDHASPHCWGTAANIFRVGDELLDTEEKIDYYARIAARVLPGVWIRPYGHDKGMADDHLHIDLGYTVAVPRSAASEAEAA